MNFYILNELTEMIYELYTNKDVIFKNAANLIMIKEIHQLKSDLFFPSSYQYRKKMKWELKHFIRKLNAVTFTDLLYKTLKESTNSLQKYLKRF